MQVRFPQGWIYNMKYYLDLYRDFEFEQSHEYFLTCTKIPKYLSIFANAIEKSNYLIKKIERVQNLKQLYIECNLSYSISMLLKSLFKLRTSSLKSLKLHGFKMTLKDLIKIIHIWDKLVEFSTRLCKINLNCKEVKINQKDISNWHATSKFC